MINFQSSFFNFQYLKRFFKGLSLSTNYQLPTTKPAFTLIESLIVMFILASSMTAALYLMSTVVFSTQASIKRTKAVYFAQECNELIRNVRDTAWLNYQTWDCAFGSAPSAGDEFIISYNYDTGGNLDAACGSTINAAVDMTPFSTGSDDDKLFQSGSLITNTPGVDSQDTGYRRRLAYIGSVDHNSDSQPDAIDLACTVDWQFNGRAESLTTPQTLSNWRRN